MFQPQYCQCSSGNEVKSTLVRHYWCDLARRRRWREISRNIDEKEENDPKIKEFSRLGIDCGKWSWNSFIFNLCIFWKRWPIYFLNFVLAVFASIYQAPVYDREAHLSDETENNDSSNGEHIYASLNISEGPSVYGHRDDQDNCLMSKDQAVYGLIEELNVAQPVLNSFEEPRRDVSHRPGQYGIVSSDEPVHSTLEETAHCFDDGTLPTQRNLEVPYLKDVEESIQYRTTGPKEPVYNTLEEPVGDDDNDPVYNTLEAPEGAEDPLHPSAVSTEEPIRHTLEQSNPNISEKADDLKFTTEPVNDIVEEDTS